MGIGIAIAVGIYYLFATVADDFDVGNTNSSPTFANVADIDDDLPGSSSQLTVNKTLTGTGANKTESFRLNGDYTVTLNTASDCYYGFSIDRTSDGNMEEHLGSHDGADSTSTRIYAVPSDSYFVDVITGPSPSCPWTVTIKG
jgi:hypothetical protein